MAFTAGQLRRGMDVYGNDGRRVGVVLATETTATPARRAENSLEGATTYSGEAAGPVSTAMVGNGGPSVQRAASGYGSRFDEVEGVVTRIKVGRFPGVPGGEWIAVERVRNVFLERVILA